MLESGYLALLALGWLLLWLPAILLEKQLLACGCFRTKYRDFLAYLILIRFILVILVVTSVIVIVIVLILIKVAQLLLVKLLVSKSLAGEPVDGPRNQLLLDILAELVVELETLLDIRRGVVIVIGGGLRRGEEVEEGLGGNGLLNNADLLGGCRRGSALNRKLPYENEGHVLLLRCFFCSTRTVRS